MGRPAYRGESVSFSACNDKLIKTAEKLNVSPSAYYSFDLRAGVTCPFAKECKSQVKDGKIVDGPHCKFRCYAASAECRLPVVYNLRQRNTQAVKRKRTYAAIYRMLVRNLPPHARVVRLHTSGDFYSYDYLKAWIDVAKGFPQVRFYAYTKALPHIERYVYEHPEGVSLSHGILSPNFRITASYGGTHDHLIGRLKIRSARVIMSEDEATLPIDTDDTHAALSGGSFNLLIHATQPLGSDAAKAWDKIRRTRGGYATRKGGASV